MARGAGERPGIDQTNLSTLAAVLCIAMLLGSSRVVHGQALFQSSPAWSTERTDATRCVAFGDLDGDADLDLVCGNAGQSTAVYWNTGATFATSPTSFGRSDNTYSVALGDVDGDGDPDLVCGNYGQSSTLYRNTDGTFTDVPVWSSGRADNTTSVALGDVDGDGDLDLVCGNEGQRTTVYRNVGGTFEDAPMWSSGRSSNTSCVALGDLDGDGDLDLVCGNSGESPLLYRNGGGTFDTAPAWSSGRADATRSVVLGDVDGDGDFDLVCGNIFQSPTLYRNVAGTFENEPAWSTGRADATNSIALADVDGDEDLDLVCGNAHQSSTLYRNAAGTFEDQPAWSSGTSGETSSVAVADVDGDGDLDLVCGNVYQSSVLFRNTSEVFAEIPEGEVRIEYTQGIALGDVDGDGDVDIVSGNWSGSSSLYRNTNGRFLHDPWSEGQVDETWGVALGDIDADGDLDLVCGNHGQPTTLYRNANGTFEPTPAWSSGRSRFTTCVTLGDVDGDGDLDLACGNYLQTPVVFRNVGGTFEDEPMWSAGRNDDTRSVALGDVDGDGDLDLVCGNNGQPTALYRNVAGSFALAWQSARNDQTRSVALGDVDGDGKLDLVCGNQGRATLYRNSGDIFENEPAWSSELSDDTAAMALGDVDGDGDLDVVCGAGFLGSSMVLYWNVGGMFANEAASSLHWSGISIGLRDVDEDGDLDLIAGNYPHSPSVFRSRISPPGDPNDARNRPVNVDARLRDVHVMERDTNLYTVQFKLLDPESDPVWVLADWQNPGGAWNAIAPAAGTRRFGPLTSSAAGVEHEFDWNVTPVSMNNGPVNLRLRSVSFPRRAGIVQRVPRYLERLESIHVQKPVADVDPLGGSLGEFTVGDTVSVDLTIRNRGNAPLTIASLNPPDALRFRSGPVGPAVLQPFGHVSLHLVLQFLQASTALEPLQLVSDDPQRPVLPVPISAQVHGLGVRTTTLVRVPAQLGEAVPVQSAQLDPESRIANIYLLHRPRGTTDFEVRPMTRYGTNWFGTIPGAAIRESGVEYYVVVQNQDVLLRDPAGAPSDSLFAFDVVPPTRIVSRPLQTSRSGFAAGLPITVSIELQTGTDFGYGELSYRVGGSSETAVDSLFFSSGSPIGLATIPATAVTARGLEYWVDLWTRGGTHLRDPEAEGRTNLIRASVERVSEERANPGGRYRIFSVPLDFGTRGTRLETFLSSQLAFGLYDPVRWRAFRWDAVLQKSLELVPGDAGFALRPGRAFWLVSRSDHQVRDAEVDALSTGPTPESGYTIELLPGWNQFGNPFDFPVRWSDVVVIDPDHVRDLARFDPHGSTRGNYANEPEVLLPFEGYFIRNTSQETRSITLPYRAAAAASPMLRASKGGGWIDGPGSWTFTLRAVGPQGAEDVILFGVVPEARGDLDSFDRAKPPPPPGSGLQVGFGHSDWGAASGSYRRDFRDPESPGHVWEISVGTTAARTEEVRLELLGREPGPLDIAVKLVDLELGTLVDLATSPDSPSGSASRSGVRAERGRQDVSDPRTTDPSTDPRLRGSYSILSHPDGRPYRLKILAGRSNYVENTAAAALDVPTRMILGQNSPNPFNATTRIRFGIPSPGLVRLEIFDIRGRLIARLLDNTPLPAGYHACLWSGRDLSSRPVASGLYVCRLSGPGGSTTRRLALIK